MARSADGRTVRRRGQLIATAALLALPLAGCTTTQHEAQRVQLDSARLRVALSGTRVTAQGQNVRPTEVRMVSSAGRTAVIVRVRNGARREMTDLPISVGYLNAAGQRVYLNDGANLGYYDAHLPAIPASATLTWVFTTSAQVPPRARLFATVGSRESVPALLTETNVRLGVRIVPSVGPDASVRVQLRNPTSVPQYQLQLYATLASGGRYLAAGDATVSELGAGSQQEITIKLVGAAATGTLHVTAPPTVLQ